MKFKLLSIGFRNIPSKKIEEELPFIVILLPSSGLVAMILIPPLKLFPIIKLPR